MSRHSCLQQSSCKRAAFSVSTSSIGSSTVSESERQEQGGSAEMGSPDMQPGLAAALCLQRR